MMEWPRHACGGPAAAGHMLMRLNRNLTATIGCFYRDSPYGDAE